MDLESEIMWPNERWILIICKIFCFKRIPAAYEADQRHVHSKFLYSDRYPCLISSPKGLPPAINKPVNEGPGKPEICYKSIKNNWSSTTYPHQLARWKCELKLRWFFFFQVLKFLLVITFPHCNFLVIFNYKTLRKFVFFSEFLLLPLSVQMKKHKQSYPYQAWTEPVIMRHINRFSLFFSSVLNNMNHWKSLKSNRTSPGTNIGRIFLWGIKYIDEITILSYWSYLA